MRTAMFASLLLCLALPPFGQAANAKTEFSVASTVKIAEKDHDFQIFVNVETDTSLTDVVVTSIMPIGFCVEALAVPGVTTRPAQADQTSLDQCGDKPSIAYVEQLGPSSFTIPFRVYPPNAWGRPQSGSKSTLYSTREDKVFAFNLSYKTGPDAVIGNMRESISLRYTTTLGHYLIAGMLGVILGYFVKTVTQNREEIVALLGKEAALFGKIRRFLDYLFLTRMPLLLTLLVVGFGVLLSLAQDALPISSWHQALALGIGVGVLGDEQLITKIKSPS